MREIKQDHGIRELCLGLLMWLLFLPEAILFVTIGTERLTRSYFGIALFLLLAALLYTAVPLVIEKRSKKVQLPQGRQPLTVMPLLVAFVTLVLKICVFEQFQVKFLSEFLGFYNGAGAIGIVGFLLQHMYYFAEMMVCCYILRLFQQAGEKIFHITDIPYGGIALGILWGLIIHTISKDLSVGLVMLVLSIAWGMIYVSSKRNRWLTYWLMSLLFIC